MEERRGAEEARGASEGAAAGVGPGTREGTGGEGRSPQHHSLFPSYSRRIHCHYFTLFLVLHIIFLFSLLNILL